MNKNFNFISALNNYQSKYHEELVYKKMMQELIQKCPNCYERSNLVGHFTASALILNETMSKILLMHHKKLNMWLQMGGHCDGDSNPLSVAIKEAQEESGIRSIIPLSEDIFDIDIHLIPSSTKEHAHYHYDVRFLLKSQNDLELTKNHESNDLQWFDINVKNLPTQEYSILRMIEKIPTYINNQIVYTV